MGDYKDKHGVTRVGAFLKGLGDVGKPILKAAAGLTGQQWLSTVADGINTSKEIKKEEKEYLLELMKHDQIEQQEVSKRWNNDMVSDSWLSKNIRPLSVAFLTFIVSLMCILDMSIDSVDIKDSWINLWQILLMTCIGGYFGSRTFEKINKIKR
jgi:hypothetical protein